MTLDEAKKELARLVERAMQGEQVVNASDDEHGVLLVPVKNWKHSCQAGTGKGLFIISDDFDDPIPGFEEYLP